MSHYAINLQETNRKKQGKILDYLKTIAFKFENASLLSGIPWASHLPRILNFLWSGLFKGKESFRNHTILVGNRLNLFIGDQSRIASDN